MPDHVPDPPARPAGRRASAWRMIFTFADDDVQLLSQEHVVMTLPPSEDLGEMRGVGVWAEVRRADGAVLDRRQVTDQLRRDVEAFFDDPERPIRRIPQTRRQGAFTVVVPDHPSGDHVVMVAGEAEEAAEGTGRVRRRDMARFPFPAGTDGGDQS